MEQSRSAITPENLAQATKIVNAMCTEIGKAVVGQADVVEQTVATLLAAGPRADRRRARPRQDAAGARAGADLRRRLRAASSSRPISCPPT